MQDTHLSTSNSVSTPLQFSHSVEKVVPYRPGDNTTSVLARSVLQSRREHWANGSRAPSPHEPHRCHSAGPRILTNLCHTLSVPARASGNLDDPVGGFDGIQVLAGGTGRHMPFNTGSMPLARSRMSSGQVAPEVCAYQYVLLEFFFFFVVAMAYRTSTEYCSTIYIVPGSRCQTRCRNGPEVCPQRA